MKLSEKIIEALMHQSGFSAESVLEEVKHLEADSELLEELIETFMDINIRFTTEGCYTEAPALLILEKDKPPMKYIASTHREAIEAAVKKYWESKK